MNKIILLLLLILNSFANAFYEDISDKNIIDSIQEKIKTIFPQIEVKKVKALEDSSNFYLIQLKKGGIIFIDKNIENIFIGELINIKNKPFSVNTTFLKKASTEHLSQIKEIDTITFTKKNTKKSTITVFTDTSCIYCKKLHNEINEINDAGIEVRYLPFPKRGFDLNNKETKNLINIWCSPDRNKALELAIKDKLDENNNDDCLKNNIVEEMYNLGVKLGVSGTPTIFLENGEKISGFIPTQKLIQKVLENN